MLTPVCPPCAHAFSPRQSVHGCLDCLSFCPNTNQHRHTRAQTLRVVALSVKSVPAFDTSRPVFQEAVSPGRLQSSFGGGSRVPPSKHRRSRRTSAPRPGRRRGHFCRQSQKTQQNPRQCQKITPPVRSAAGIREDARGRACRRRARTGRGVGRRRKERGRVGQVPEGVENGAADQGQASHVVAAIRGTR